MRKIFETLKQKWTEYLLEILVITIGILLAFTLNNYSVAQNEKTLEIKLYENLLTSLSSDSKDLQIIIEVVNQSLEAQEIIISKPVEEIVAEYSESEIRKIVLDVIGVGRSFFPKYGAYKQITNEGLMGLISSEDIKSHLIEVYDLNYKRYEHIDNTIEQKSEFGLNDLIYGKMNFGSDDFDVEIFKKYYQELQYQCRTIRPLSINVNEALKRNNEAVYLLITSLQKKIKSK